MIGVFGNQLKELFVQTTPIAEYTKALLDFIQSTYYIEEWLRRVLQLKLQKQKEAKPFPQNDN